jgi:hypothetical protein
MDDRRNLMKYLPRGAFPMLSYATRIRSDECSGMAAPPFFLPDEDGGRLGE